MKTGVFSLHAKFNKIASLLMGIPIFILVAVLYLQVSSVRHAENPDDKLFPTIEQIQKSITKYATEPESRRKQTPRLVADTMASLQRIAFGIALATIVGIFIGLNMGMFKWVDNVLYSFINITSSVPPVAIMPILLIAFGKDDLGKIMMIFFGLVFALIQTIRLATKEIPKEQIIKAQTLGASTLGIVYRVVLPQIMPRALDAIRVNIGLAWIFLIVAEFISANQGLGYRIFLVRRYLDMSVILPYVGWITILGFTMMMFLKFTNRIVFPWYGNH